MNFPDFPERQSSLITMESISKYNIKKYKSATLNPLCIIEFSSLAE